ncbi:10332_t:CDS:1, partial [Racocetra fulgida]
PEKLKLQIVSMQAEIERLRLVILEFLGKTIIATKNNQTMQPLNESLQKLSNKLLNAFSSTDSKAYKLFIGIQKMTNTG